MIYSTSSTSMSICFPYLSQKFIAPRKQKRYPLGPSHPAINLDETGRAACGKAAHKPGIVILQGQNHGKTMGKPWENHGKTMGKPSAWHSFFGSKSWWIPARTRFLLRNWCFDMAKDGGFWPKPQGFTEEYRQYLLGVIPCALVAITSTRNPKHMSQRIFEYHN